MSINPRQLAALTLLGMTLAHTSAMAVTRGCNVRIEVTATINNYGEYRYANEFGRVSASKVLADTARRAARAKALGQFAYGVDHPTDRILDNISLDNLVDRVLDRSVNGTWEILAQEWTNDTPSNSNCNGYTSAKLAVTQSGGRRSYKVTQRPWP